MELNTLRDALRAQPFKPFTICLADGRSEYIKHPEFVALGTRVVVVVREDNSVMKIEPILIVSLDEDGTGRKGRNGSSKRKPKE
jgi:hypothetical protein